MTNEFGVTDDTAVVTSTYVTEDDFPILEVSCEDDEEGGRLWQFHCGNGDYSMEKMQLVRLDTLLGIDPSLLGISGLEIGEVARRESADAKWTISKSI